MATKSFRGDAPKVAEVRTVTVTAYDAATTYILTIGRKSISVLGSGGTPTTVAAALVAAWNASTIPEFAEITASNIGAAITLTHDIPGVPFAVTPSVSGGTGTIGSVSVTTAATGPNHWNEAKNWSDGAVPATGDSVDLQDCDTDILYGLAQSAVTLARLTRHETFTGAVGLPEINREDAASTYAEYRDKELAIGVTLLEVKPSNAARFRINGGSVQSQVVVHGTGAGSVTDETPLSWRGTHASNVVMIRKGTVDIAMGSGEVATLTLKIGYEDQIESDAIVRVGRGVTLAAVDKGGGELHTYGAVTAGTQYAGAWHHYDGTFGTPLFRGGTLYYMSDDQMSSPIFTGDAVLDCSRDLRARTISDAKFHDRAGINDRYKTVTWTNGIDFVQRAVGGNVDLGMDLTVTPSAI